MGVALSCSYFNMLEIVLFCYEVSSWKTPQPPTVCMPWGASFFFLLCLFLLTGLELNLWVTWQWSYPPRMWVISSFRWGNISLKNQQLNFCETCSSLTDPFPQILRKWTIRALRTGTFYMKTTLMLKPSVDVDFVDCNLYINFFFLPLAHLMGLLVQLRPLMEELMRL